MLAFHTNVYNIHIFNYLKKLNSSIQCRNTYVDKIKGLKDKIKIWKIKVNTNNVKMFNQVTERKYNNTDLPKLIYRHLTSLEEKLIIISPTYQLICMTGFEILLWRQYEK